MKQNRVSQNANRNDNWENLPSKEEADHYCYDLNSYINDVKSVGLQSTWEWIFQHYDEIVSDIITVNNFGELYEIGLECLDKADKKEHGKYFTPPDVALLMSSWLKALPGENVCDVCCGTGNLILSYFHVIGAKRSKELIQAGRIYLYDIDSTAIYICRQTIGLLYGSDIIEHIHGIVGDFLNRDILLPESAKVISNPPYFKITEQLPTWDNSAVIEDSRELYSAIMEKILKQSVGSVIITPYSFISGSKFQSLRAVMAHCEGSIVAFDNIPGCIFNGRKHGIFNSNKANSVRAAITISQQSDEPGYRVSPMIRFKHEERNQVIKKSVLSKLLPATKQMPYGQHGFYKCAKTLTRLYNKWNRKSEFSLGDLLTNQSAYTLCVPNSCRYFTVASVKDLNRTGKYLLHFQSYEDMLLAYAFLNSSFCYWHWRLFDGGINYSAGLLKDMPMFRVRKTDKEELEKIVVEMMQKEQDFLVYKNNAQALQESIKFPCEYRTRLNEILCRSLGYSSAEKLLVIHNNSFCANER